MFCIVFHLPPVLLQYFYQGEPEFLHTNSLYFFRLVPTTPKTLFLLFVHKGDDIKRQQDFFSSENNHIMIDQRGIRNGTKPEKKRRVFIDENPKPLVLSPPKEKLVGLEIREDGFVQDGSKPRMLNYI